MIEVWNRVHVALVLGIGFCERKVAMRGIIGLCAVGVFAVVLFGCCKETSEGSVDCAACFKKPRCKQGVQDCRSDPRCPKLYNCFRHCDSMTSQCANDCVDALPTAADRDDTQLGYKAGFVWGCMGSPGTECRKCELK